MTVESPPEPMRKAKLSSLQAMRGVAALLVVVFHAAAIWRELSGASGFAGPWDSGWAGVDLFFVISGFVMVWVAGERPAGLGTSGRFLFDRVTRIYPLWWVFCALMGLYFFLTYGQPAAPNLSSAAKAWPDFALSMVLWPSGQMPVLQVGWTLIFEMGFYIVFAAVLLLPPRMRPAAMLAWAAILVGAWIMRSPSVGFPSSPLDLLLHPLCLEFLMGAAVGWLVLRKDVPVSVGWASAVIGLAAFTIFMVLTTGYDGLELGKYRTVRFGLASAMILLGLVVLEREGRLRMPAFLQRLGDASYTLYLSHFIVILVLKRLCNMAGLFTDGDAMSMIGFMVIAIVASVIAALILYPLLERPLLRLSRAPLAKRRRHGQNPS